MSFGHVSLFFPSRGCITLCLGLIGAFIGDISALPRAEKTDNSEATHSRPSVAQRPKYEEFPFWDARRILYGGPTILDDFACLLFRKRCCRPAPAHRPENTPGAASNASAPTTTSSSTPPTGGSGTQDDTHTHIRLLSSFLPPSY